MDDQYKTTFEKKQAEATDLQSKINDTTPPEPPTDPTKTITFDATVNASTFIYPTLIVIPTVMVIIIIITTGISTGLKFLLVLLLILSLGSYILQIKKLNIAALFAKVSEHTTGKKK